VCRMYKTPKTVDPKVPNPRTVFELPDPVPNDEAKVFDHGIKMRRKIGIRGEINCSSRGKTKEKQGRKKSQGEKAEGLGLGERVKRGEINFI